MESKDPAVLFYINDWLVATAEMDANCRGWYLNLILHHYDKGSLPNDIEKLAVLAGVKFSEFQMFKQVFEQVLQQKFTLSENGRLKNAICETILRSRELFKEKRSASGKWSYLKKYFKNNFPKEFENSELIEFIKNNIDLSINTSDEQVIQQVFKHLCQLYINENENINININNNDIDRESVRGEEIFKKGDSGAVAGKIGIKTRFQKPTLSEIEEYCKLRNNGIDAQYFFDSNEAKGWVVGKNSTPMKDWRATIRTWEKYTKDEQKVIKPEPVLAKVASAEEKKPELSAEQQEEIIIKSINKSFSEFLQDGNEVFDLRNIKDNFLVRKGLKSVNETITEYFERMKSENRINIF